MQQYHAAKREHPDCLLFFRLGDFFELFYEDAAVAAKDLDITLTQRRDRKGGPIPMCGVPAHAAEGYLAKLLRKGHRVAICDQVERPPKGTKGLVRREVVRVLSPGTSIDLSLLSSSENNYLAALHHDGDVSGLAYADVSTGEFRVTELPSAEAGELISALSAKEVLSPSDQPDLPFDSRDDAGREASGFVVTGIDPWIFEMDYGERLILETFGLHNLDGLGISGRPRCVCAAGALVHYLKDTQRQSLGHLDPPAYLEQKNWMVLDRLTIRHLELFDPLYQSTRTTLLNTLNRTATPMGARLQRDWLLHPSMDRDEIDQRLEAVSSLCADTITRSELRRELRQLHDIERLSARVALGSAGPREIYNLGTSLQSVPVIRDLVGRLDCPRTRQVHDRLDSLNTTTSRILSTLVADPPVTIGDGSAIADGFDGELDELRAIQRNSRRFIAQLEQREREATGIESLKVRFNNVFGFFLEVSRANLSRVPASYDRKQTLVNAERFTTGELKELEAKVLDAEERIGTRAAEIFEALCREVAGRAQRIRRTAQALAEIDVFRSLAQVAVEGDYSRPTFSGKSQIHIEGARHPVVERMLAEGSERFIENNVYLDDTDHQVAIVTGPNMGGKSTYLRQTALICIMAQSGSFVPARKAVLPLVDRVFTRIGASDNVALGRSTFMVEMTETAQILNTASEHSLILLDEVGRGTATYDGLAIAWAVAEHIVKQVRAKTLFATHYHELTALQQVHSGIFNLHVSARQTGDRIVFLRRVEAGSADRSYGIEVARLAGLPQVVLRRASEVLERLERERTAASDVRHHVEGSSGTRQPTIFETLKDPISEELRSLKIDELTPLEALCLMYEWKAALDEET